MNPQVVEMTTGMNYWDGQKWTPSDPSFETADNGFSVNRTQHKVHLAPDLNVVGAVTVTTRDGITLNSTPVGIGLFDSASGNFSLIGTVTNSTGVLIDSNKVVYANAFSGICADVVYTMQRGGFHQDVVITGQIDPATFGFPKATTRIQVITEFYNAPEPKRKHHFLHREKNSVRRQQMASPDLVDETLGFGEFVMGSGKAFSDGAGASRHKGTPVGKEFRTVDGRNFLLESVEYSAIQKKLQALPTCNPQSSATSAKRTSANAGYAAIPKPLPLELAVSQVKLPAKPITLAQAKTAIETGVAIDYAAYVGSTVDGDFTFARDTTYLIAGPVAFNGHVVFEAATVIKYTLSDTGSVNAACITLNGSFVMGGTSYSPVIFTASDDDGIGHSMYSIDPNYVGVNQMYQDGAYQGGQYASPALDIECEFSGDLSNIRISYAEVAINDGLPSVDLTVSHAQLVNCMTGLQLSVSDDDSNGMTLTPGTITLVNCLFANVGSPLALSLTGGTVNIIQCTFDNVSALGQGNATCLNVTNSVFANDLDDWTQSWMTGSHNGFYNSQTFGDNAYTTENSPFQTLIYGNHYLAPNTFQGKGTGILDPAVVARMNNKSTQAPLQFPNVYEVRGSLTLFPQVTRFTAGVSNQPDLGFHYDALDYTVEVLYLHGGSLTVEPGTAIGVWTGFWITEGSTLNSVGMPMKPITYAQVNLVQEGQADYFADWIVQFYIDYTPQGYPDYFRDGENNPNDLPPPSLNFRFSSFYVSIDSYQFFAGQPVVLGVPGSTLSALYLNLRDCNLYGGIINLNLPSWDYIGQFDPALDPVSPGGLFLTNTLFDRVLTVLQPQIYDFRGPDGSLESVGPDFPMLAYNCLFHGGFVSAVPVPSTGGNWVFSDNLFDQTILLQDTNLPMDYHNNAYRSYALDDSHLAYWEAHGFNFTNRWLPTQTGDGTTDGTGDLVLTSALPYQAGPLGNYYLPNTTPLYGAGSRAAAAAGLYHYTTRLDQGREGYELTSHVKANIGLHYIAVGFDGQPWDSDGDGIPDYVENWHGDGAYASHTDTETDWQNQHTISGVFDPTNSLYDNVDLDNDGLTGMQERLIGTNPLIPDNPLNISRPLLSQLFGLVSLPLHISSTVPNDMYVALTFNDDVGDAFVSPQNGDWHAAWDTTHVTNGIYSIKLEIVTNGIVINSLPSIVSVQNYAWLPDPWNVAGNAIYIGVQTPYTDGNGRWSVDTYDDQTNYVGSFSGIIDNNGYLSYSGNTNDGFSINNVDENGDQNPSTFYTLVFSGDTDHPLSAYSPYSFTNVQNIERPWDFGTWSALCYQQVFGSGTDGRNELLQLMQTVASAINMVHPLEPPKMDNVQNPFCLGQQGGWADVISGMRESKCRDFYYFGHGDGNTLGSGNNQEKSDGVGGLGYALLNADASGNLAFPGKGLLIHPYRFVFLDGCNTANGNWPLVFGIPNKENMHITDFTRKKGIRPRAFVGWNTFKAYTDIGQTGQLDVDHEKFLSAFWNAWTHQDSSGLFDKTLQQAVAGAQGAASATFSKAIVYGATDLSYDQ